MIRSAKGGERPVKLTDGGGPYLLIMPSGSRRWRMQFRYAGKQKLLTFRGQSRRFAGRRPPQTE